MTGAEWLGVFILAIMVLTQVEDLEEAYRERTAAMLKIAGVATVNEESRLLAWVKQRLTPKAEETKK
jgi:hypothetical protein